MVDRALIRSMACSVTASVPGKKTRYVLAHLDTVDGLEPDGTDAANAALISTAPELYETLRAVVDDHDAALALALALDGNPPSPCSCRYCEQARPVLSKADGGAS